MTFFEDDSSDLYLLISFQAHTHYMKRWMVPLPSLAAERTLQTRISCIESFQRWKVPPTSLIFSLLNLSQSQLHRAHLPGTSPERDSNCGHNRSNCGQLLYPVKAQWGQSRAGSYQQQGIRYPYPPDRGISVVGSTTAVVLIAFCCASQKADVNLPQSKEVMNWTPS